MTIINKEILLLKAQTEDSNDKYEKILAESGFSVKHIQTLEFKFINLAQLTEKLNNVDIYDGIIFTSPRAVNATKLSLNDAKIDEQWKAKDNFVVGESTFDAALIELGLKCLGKESGNANNLADLLLQGNYENFLFPCGSLKKETLGSRLKEHGVNLDSVTVYETVPNSSLKNEIVNLTSNFAQMPEFIVYFSPSGVKFTSGIFREVSSFTQTKLVAIGPSTEEALKNEGFYVYSVAKKPTEVELLNAVLPDKYKIRN